MRKHRRVPSAATKPVNVRRASLADDLAKPIQVLRQEIVDAEAERDRATAGLRALGREPKWLAAYDKLMVKLDKRHQRDVLLAIAGFWAEQLRAKRGQLHADAAERKPVERAALPIQHDRAVASLADDIRAWRKDTAALLSRILDTADTLSHDFGATNQVIARWLLISYQDLSAFRRRARRPQPNPFWKA